MSQDQGKIRQFVTKEVAGQTAQLPEQVQDDQEIAKTLDILQKATSQFGVKIDICLTERLITVRECIKLIRDALEKQTTQPRTNLPRNEGPRTDPYCELRFSGREGRKHAKILDRWGTHGGGRGRSGW